MTGRARVDVHVPTPDRHRVWQLDDWRSVATSNSFFTIRIDARIPVFTRRFFEKVKIE